MKKLISMAKLALVVGVLASVGTGCCLFGNDECCEKECTRACPKKTHGANASMRIGVGTSGISAGAESNLGSHGASGSMSTH